MMIANSNRNNVSIYSYLYIPYEKNAVNKTKIKTGVVDWKEEINVIGIMNIRNPMSNCNKDLSVSITYTIMENVSKATMDPRKILLVFN